MEQKPTQEVIAAIMAAIQTMFANKVVAVRIKRNDIWAISGRQSI